MVHKIRADILIIGGGTAGTLAAIRAKELNPDAKVIVFEKADLMYSGSIACGMDAFNVAAVPGFSTPEEYLETAHGACEEIVDDSQCYSWVSRTWETVQKLEEWGAYFPKDESGKNIVLDVAPKGKFCLAITEPKLKKLIAMKAVELGVKVYNRTMGIDLIKQDEKVVGALGINTRTSEIIACMAKAVILCAGGTARFGETTNGYPYGTFDFPGNTGEAYRMAYNAGAELTGFEYTIVDYSVKDINAAGLHISCTRGAIVVDGFGNEVEESALSISDLLSVHNKGRGPLRVKMQHLSEDKIQEIESILFTTERPVQERFFKNRGMDFRKDDIEQWPSECFLCGGHGLTGIMVNAKAESSVDGLYAAGDAANVRGFMSGAFVMGIIAAESATEYIKSVDLPEFEEYFVSDRVSAIEKVRNMEGPVSLQEFENKLRRTVTNYIAPPKNEFKLNRALQEVDRFRKELETIVGIQGMEEVYKYFELESIIVSAQLSATASLSRKESRWGEFHKRTDYPVRDDENWLKHVVLKKGTEENTVTVTYKNVERMN